jgi:hypothetical protein
MAWIKQHVFALFIKKIGGITIEDYSVSITVDIEDWYHIPPVCGSSFSVNKDREDFFHEWTGRYDYLTGPTRRVLGILDEQGTWWKRIIHVLESPGKFKKNNLHEASMASL